ncbi:TonB family protein [Pandoraea sp. SD6-2]|uniref:TonB family protein n=1 Tax=Pandoraea sp. SD6-2 TaxID=1286093 RepID=UPI003527B00E
MPFPPSKDGPEASIWCQRPKPYYPAEWADAGEVGVVKIRVVVAPSERVVSASVVQSSGFVRLDDAALAAAKAVRCRAVTGDIPSPGFSAIMPISFEAH